MYLTLKEAADLLRMNPETLRVKCANGKIPGAFRTNGDTGNWRLDSVALRQWAHDREVFKRLVG
jgi:hypothetical protein